MLAPALEARLWANWYPDGVDVRLDTALELFRLAERQHMQELAVVARRWRVVALLEADRWPTQGPRSPSMPGRHVRCGRPTS